MTVQIANIKNTIAKSMIQQIVYSLTVVWLGIWTSKTKTNINAIWS